MRAVFNRVTTRRHAMLSVLSAAAMIGTASCGSSTDVTPSGEILDVFVGSKVQALAMDRGAVIQLGAERRSADGTVLEVSPAATYTSRRPSVADVTSGGRVVGVGAGSTYIIATLDRPNGVRLIDSIAVTVVLPNQ